MNRLILLLCVSMASVTIQAQAPKPNVVFVMTDDMGYGDLGSYGGTDIRTPVLDRLAREGVRFTDFYANGPTCSPTRAGLITGRYQQRYGIEAPLPSSDPENRVGLPARGHSLPQLMKDAGYRTGLIGKWHLGLGADKSPRAHGFEHFFGFKSGYIDYYTHNSGSGEPDLWLDDAPTQQDGYMTDLITAHSVDFIRSSADKPFFLSVQYNAPHWPYQVPDKPSVAIRNAAHLQPHDENTGTREQYVAMLERVDQGIGEILAALEKAGVARNTLVIFTNDNGGEWLARNSPLFHRKWTVWEGGIRVPAIMRWPGVIPAGQVTPQVGITMDFTATMLALAGAKKPDGYAPEGIDLLPIVSGRAPVVERTLFWRIPTARAVRSGDLKLVVDGGSTLVFNVREDPGENRDLTNSRQQDARRLRGLLDAWVADVDAGREVRVPAPAARPPPLVPGATPTPEQAAAQAAERERQARMPDTPGTGRFPAMKEEVPSLPNHVVYRPRSLDSLGATKLGVYVFGNGGCVDDGASSRLHLLEVASHGYLVIAPGRIRTGPGATAPAAPGAPTTRSSARDLTTALDWALAQNADPKSPFHNRIDPKALAVSGYSCGGAQAIKVAADPRWKTVVMMNSGILNVPLNVSLADMDASKDLLPTLHTPVLYTLGGESDVAYVNGMDDFRRIDHVPVFIADLKGVGHGGSYWEPNGGKAAAVVVAWLDWQLRGDADAARMFTGKDCDLCRDPAWEIHRKKIP